MIYKINIIHSRKKKHNLVHMLCILIMSIFYDTAKWSIMKCGGRIMSDEPSLKISISQFDVMLWKTP